MQRDEFKLRHEIVQVCHLMYQKGLIVASDGNVSARLDNERLLITPSGLHKGLIEPHELMVVDMSGRVVGGRTAVNRTLKPTSELPMHLEAYRLRPDIESVVHAHPPVTIALSIAGIPMADCLLPEVIVFLGIIPTTQYATPSSEENVHAIRAFIQKHDGLVLQRHGSLTVGNSPIHGFMRLETLEQQARIRFMLEQIDGHQPLAMKEVKKLLNLRHQLGLGHPDEADDFCNICGTCHDEPSHLPTLWHEPNGGKEINTAEVRALVEKIVATTLGNSS